MSLENTNEDDVDTEALQAQIDLSMAFAQSLVDSWMEPHKLPPTSRRQDLEQELAEYMKRPPRLGVGASIPEGHQSMTRETARLKGKLTGSKRTREEVDIAPPKPLSDDEEESKVGAIKKKPRPDPFDAISGKKKKKEKNLSSEERPSLPATSVSSSSNDVRPVKVEEEPLMNDIALADSTPSKRKKKRKKTIHNQEEDPAGSLDEPTSQPLDDRSKSPVNESSGDLPIPSTPTRQVRAKIEPLDQPLDVSFMGTPTANPTSPRKTLPVDLLKTPLLNLNGPLQSDPESDADPTESPTTSPKKKRRRKKKKKHPTGAPEASQSNSLPTPVAQ